MFFSDCLLVYQVCLVCLSVDVLSYLLLISHEGHHAFAGLRRHSRSRLFKRLVKPAVFRTMVTLTHALDLGSDQASLIHLTASWLLLARTVMEVAIASHFAAIGG